MNQKKIKQKKKTIKPGCIFWIALILLGITVFLINQKNIEEVLASTGFFEIFSREKSIPQTGTINVERITDSSVKKPEAKTVKDTEIELVSAVTKPEIPVHEKEKDPVAIEEKEVILSRTRESILYFIQVNDNGSISLRQIARNIKFTDSPLTATISSLLSGPGTEEISKNYITLIPEKTVLNKIYLSEKTAYIDFNEYFLFNSFGREGYIGQLKQVVYTATEFSTVEQVQFLIDGKINSYLGSEGIYTGKPVKRDSFN